MEKFLTVLLSGGVNGLVYALIGLAFVLIFRVDRVVNLALGECAMFGALVAYEVSKARGYSLVVAALAVLVVGGSIGAITEVGILRRMRTRDPLRVLILSFGIALVLQSVARIIWSTDLYSLPTFPGVPEVIRVFYRRSVLQGQGLWIIAFAAAAFLGWALLLKRSSLGRDLRAVSSDREVAEAMGIPASRLILGAYVVGCALAAFAGFIVSPVLFMSYSGGTLLGLKGLIAALVGGLQRPLGPLVGGLLLGLAEAATAGYYKPDWKEVTVFTVLIALLLVRPQGILTNAAEAA
jgi:branched-chain amino acid transport system permease protein